MPRRKRKRENGHVPSSSWPSSPSSKLPALCHRVSGRFYGVQYIPSLGMYQADYLGKSLGYFVDEERAGVAVDEHRLTHEFRLAQPLNACINILECLLLQVEKEKKEKNVIGETAGECEAYSMCESVRKSAATLLRRQALTFPNKTGEVDGVWEHEQKVSRSVVLQKQWKEAEKVVKRMIRLDRYGLFTDQPNLRISLVDIEMGLADPTQSPYRSSTTNLNGKAEGNDGKKEDDDGVVLNWTRLLRHVETMCKDAVRKCAGAEAEALKVKRWLQTASQLVENAKDKLEAQLRQFEIEEKLDALQESNQEPAVQGKWIKTPYDITPYERVEGYIPNRGLPKPERDLVMQKIITTKPSEPKPLGLTLTCDIILSNGSRNGKKRLNGCSSNGHVAAVIKEKNVWGIDCFTKRSIQLAGGGSEASLADFLRRKLLPALNAQGDEVSHNMVFALELICQDKEDEDLCAAIVKSIEMFGHHNFRVWPKGRAVIAQESIPKDTYVTDYLGALMPAWRWFELCVAVELVQRTLKLSGQLPAFYNIMLERQKDCPEGYDLVFVDASEIGNFASRLSHSCSPNCASRVAVVDGKFAIQMRTIKDVIPGEELTHDYHASTDDMAEFQAAICLCGTQDCRGSYLYHTQDDAYLKIIRRDHGLLERLAMVVESCESELRPSDLALLDKHALRSSVIDGLPDWGKKFASLILTVIERESDRLMKDRQRRTKLRSTAPASASDEDILTEEEITGIAATRVQSLVIALDKIKYICRATGDSSPPIHRLSDEELLVYLWNGPDSIAKKLLAELEALSSKSKSKSKGKGKGKGKGKTGFSKKTVETLEKLRKLCRSKLGSIIEARQGLQQVACLVMLLANGQKRSHLKAAQIVTSYSLTQALYRVYAYPEFTSPPLEINQTHIGGITESLLNRLDTPEPTVLGGTMRISVKPSNVNGQCSSTSKRGSPSPKGSRSRSRSPRKRKRTQPLRRSVVAEKTYKSDELLRALLNWIEPLSTNEVDFRKELYGAAWFPCIEGAYQSKSKLSAVGHQEKLIEHLSEDPFMAFPAELKASFGELAETGVFGTPMLDQRRRRVHNAVQIFSAALEKHSELLESRRVEATNWLQCDSCDKWRKVPASAAMDDLPDTFVCADNDWEPEYASCDIPQEEWEGVVTQLDTKLWTDDELKPGTKLDVFCDKSCVWSGATITKQNEERFRVHYHGWNKRYDEWIPKSQLGFKRIATFGTHAYA